MKSICRQRFMTGPVCAGSPGFALIVSITLMAMLLLLMVSFSILLTIEVQFFQISKTRQEARLNALMGLQIALAHLQEMAGPDQRITATASLLENSSSPPLPSQSQWTGVWSTEDYDPYTPQNRTFLGWLASGNSGASPFSAIDDITSRPDNPVYLVRGDSDDSSVIAGKIPLPHQATGHPGHYAWWVEDLGVKADITRSGYRVPEFPSSRDLIDALGATPAVYSGLLLNEPDIETPLGGDEESRALLEDLARLTHRHSAALITESMDFQQENWIDFATGVYGLATDSLHGGLKYDLSLAFEMDGAEFDENDLTGFNSSEFAGTGNRSTLPTSALQAGPGQDFITNHVFIEPFTFQGGARFARGTTWHLLRDYYNQYKRLKGTASPILEARGFSPDASLWAGNHTYADHIFARLQLGQETNSQGRYITLPTRGAYAPVVLKNTFIFSLQLYDYDPGEDTGRVAVVLDPVVFLWNPYDVALEFDTLKIVYADAMFEITLEATDGSGSVLIKTSDSKKDFRSLVEMNTTPSSGYDNFVIHYLQSETGNTVMAPGEVMVFSSIQPGVYESVEMRQILKPGVTFSPDGGTRFTQFAIGGESDEAAPFEVPDLSTATVTAKVGLSAGKRFLTFTMLADSADLVDAPNSSLRKKRSSSDQDLQFQSVNASSSSNPDGSSLEDNSVVFGHELINAGVNKIPVLSVENSIKASQPQGNAVPIPLFTPFNPLAYMATITAQWRINAPNRHILFREFISYEDLGETTNLNAYWGKSYTSSGSTHIIGFSIPQEPLLSLAGMRHANKGFHAFEVPQAIGNSFAHVQVPFNAVVATQDGHEGKPWDTSWLINQALWDRYFFSGLTPEFSRNASGYNETRSLSESIDHWTTGLPGRNPRYRFFAGDSSNPGDVAASLKQNDGYRKTAAYTLIEGSFNVNSTSPRAWAAFLSGLLNIPVPLYGTTSSDTAQGLPVLKSRTPYAGSGDLWNGFQRLSATDLYDPSDNTGLAFEIVKEVKARGPFMGLADFINRRLSNDNSGRMGALQSAIENSGLNHAVASEGVSVNHNEFANPNAGPEVTSGGISGYIMQADLLEPIAPFLSARSDTFIIRAYGDVGGLSNATHPAGVAICEAVVQRIPDYVKPLENDPRDQDDALSALNKQLGRRFQIVSFRWLDPAQEGL